MAPLPHGGTKKFGIKCAFLLEWTVEYYVILFQGKHASGLSFINALEGNGSVNMMGHVSLLGSKKGPPGNTKKNPIQ